MKISFLMARWTATIGAVLLAAISIACTGAGRTPASRLAACGLADSDSAFLRTGMVYRDCAVDRRARLLTTNIHPDYRPTPPRTMCYSADLEFVVDASGSPETRTARVVRTNDQGYAESLVATLGSWTYQPAMKDAAPVRQIVIEHQFMAIMVAIVRAGSPPPIGRAAQAPPRC